MRCGMKPKIILVTGSAKGIGKAIAEVFNTNEYIVIYGYHKSPINDENKYSINIDISSRDSVKNAFKSIKEEFGSIDILINNGAIAQEKPFLDISDNDWENMLNTNLAGAYRCIQEALPDMINKKWGRIINISSIGGQWGGFNQVHYAASKAGLISLTQSIAKIYSKDGITSNAISPGLIETDMIANELSTKAGQEKLKTIPMERMGTTIEIANIAKFLASEDSSYITGQTINANGGMYFG